MYKLISFLPYRITGDSFELLRQYDANSRKKIIQLGWFVMIPTLLWFITGFLISSSLLDQPALTAILTGLACSAFIFIVERSIILAKKSNWLLILCRITLGLCVALFGSALLDLVIFKGDIGHYAKEKFLNDKKAEADSASAFLEGASNRLNEEMQGTGGSKKKGYGEISKELKSQQEEARQRLKQIKVEISHFNDVISNSGHPEYQGMVDKLGMKTVAYRAELLHQLIKEDWFKMTIWVLLIVIGFMMEFMPIVTKLGSRPSAYELDQEAMHSILANRRLKALQKSDYYARLGREGVMAEQAFVNSCEHPLL